MREIVLGLQTIGSVLDPRTDIVLLTITKHQFIMMSGVWFLTCQSEVFSHLYEPVELDDSFRGILRDVGNHDLDEFLSQEHYTPHLQMIPYLANLCR